MEFLKRRKHGQQMVVLAIGVLTVNDQNVTTYLLESGVALVDSNDLSGGLNQVESLVVIDELLLHASVVLDIWWLVHSLGDLLSI